MIKAVCAELRPPPLLSSDAVLVACCPAGDDAAAGSVLKTCGGLLVTVPNRIVVYSVYESRVMVRVT
jgi:hypothetical protein